MIKWSLSDQSSKALSVDPRFEENRNHDISLEILLMLRSRELV